MMRKPIHLPGKIAVQSTIDTISIYNNSSRNKIDIGISNNDSVRYDGFRWLYNNTGFVGIEYIQASTGGSSRGNVVKLNLSGSVEERLYESAIGEFAAEPFVSTSGNQLLFALEERGDVRIDLLESFNRHVSIAILDLATKRVIKKIPDLGISSTFQINETPWLYKQNRFIYSILSDPKIQIEGAQTIPLEKNLPGLYLYDCVTDQKALLVPGAQFGICSPTELKIAYIKNASVCVLDLNSNLTKEVYISRTTDHIGNIHWTPDGVYLYILSYNLNSKESQFEEKLINVTDGRSIPFVKIGHGVFPYTWK